MASAQDPEIGSASPPNPRVTWYGKIRTEWVDGRAVDEFVTALSRLRWSREATVFFGSVSLATLPSVGSKDRASWLVVLFGIEAIASIVATIVWLSRRPRLARARGALGTNRLIREEDYGAPPPTKRDGPPPVQDNLAQAAESPRTSINEQPTQRTGPPTPDVGEEG